MVSIIVHLTIIMYLLKLNFTLKENKIADIKRNSWFLILDSHVKNKTYGNVFSISSLTGKCAAQKLKKLLQF